MGNISDTVVIIDANDQVERGHWSGILASDRKRSLVFLMDERGKNGQMCGFY